MASDTLLLLAAGGVVEAARTVANVPEANYEAHIPALDALDEAIEAYDEAIEAQTHPVMTRVWRC